MVRAHIDHLAEQYETRGLKPNSRQIEKELAGTFPAPEIPSERTIRYIVSRRTRDESEPWAPMTNEPDIDPSLAMPVLALVIEASEGTRRHLTRAEARLVTAVRTAAPNIAPATALAVAREYISGTTAHHDIDAFLAFAPWTGDDARSSYENTLAERWVQAPGVWLRQRQIEGAVAAVNKRRDAMRSTTRTTKRKGQRA